MCYCYVMMCNTASNASAWVTAGVNGRSGVWVGCRQESGTAGRGLLAISAVVRMKGWDGAERRAL